MIALSDVLSQESLHDPFLFLYSGVKLWNIVNNMVTHVFVIFDLDLIVGKSAHAPSDPNFTSRFRSIYIVVLNKLKKSFFFCNYIIIHDCFVYKSFCARGFQEYTKTSILYLIDNQAYR